jgi:hypothetical protein
MMGTLVTVLAGGMIGAGVGSGMAEKKEAMYNAGILNQQAGMIEEQKKLQAMQDDRAIRSMMGKTVAATAGKGIELQGSPMAIMIDTRTQMEFDKAITQYNYDMQKFGVMAQAEAVKRKGNLAMMYGVTSGVTSAAGTMVSAFGPSMAAQTPKKSISTDTAKFGKGA